MQPGPGLPPPGPGQPDRLGDVLRSLVQPGDHQARAARRGASGPAAAGGDQPRRAGRSGDGVADPEAVGRGVPGGSGGEDVVRPGAAPGRGEQHGVDAEPLVLGEQLREDHLDPQGQAEPDAVQLERHRGRARRVEVADLRVRQQPLVVPVTGPAGEST